MQLNIFLKVAPFLKEKEYKSEDVLIFLEKNYKSGDWIYPGIVGRKTNNDIKNVYAVLEECCKQKIIERYFDIYCPICCRLIGERYVSFISIPNDLFCPICDNEIKESYKKAIIIYKVL